MAGARPAMARPGAWHVTMFEHRLALVDRIRIVERRLARAEQARAAAELLRGHSHQLGNSIQIVRLASVELERQHTPEQAHLITDLRTAAEQAVATANAIFAVARPVERGAGSPVAAAIRTGVDLVRSAVQTTIELAIEIPETDVTRLDADELEVLVIAAVLDAATATHISLVVRTRTMSGKPHVELLRLDDRGGPLDTTIPPHSLLDVVDQLAHAAGGDCALADGRGRHELAVALPQDGDGLDIERGSPSRRGEQLRRRRRARSLKREGRSSTSVATTGKKQPPPSMHIKGLSEAR